MPDHNEKRRSGGMRPSGAILNQHKEPATCARLHGCSDVATISDAVLIVNAVDMDMVNGRRNRH